MSTGDSYYFSAAQLEAWIPPETTKLCLFASYEAAEIAQEHILYVNTLAEHFDVVLYLSNTRETQKPALFLHPNVRCVGCPNYGLDFGMWCRVLKELPRRALQQVGLVNDSCHLLHPSRLLRILSELPTPAGDAKYMWGMTESSEVSFHLQSFFLVVGGGQAIEELKQFARERRIEDDGALDKLQIISKYEMGLSVYLREKGVRLVSQYPAEQFPDVNPYINRAYRMWDRLLEAGMPIVKKTRGPIDVGLVSFRHTA